MKEWYTNIYKAFIFAGIISFIIGFFTSSTTSLGAYIAGYSVFALAILMILTILFYQVLKFNNNNNSFFSTIYNIFFISGPFLLILSVISIVLYLLIKYKNNIIDEKIAPGYNSFSNIIVILLLVQFYILYNNINTEQFERTGKMPKVTNSIVYLVGVLTFICSIILYTILKYYSTDGFIV
jgi:hypothetical protein